MPATVSTIQIAIEAQTATLKKGFADARRATDQLGTSLSGKVAMGIAKFHGALAAARDVVRTATIAVQELLAAMADIDKVEKFAARIGVVGDQLRIMQFAAEQTGVSADTLNMGLQRMTRRVAEAAKGTGEAKDALIELGLHAGRLNELRPDQVFAAIANQMQKVEKQSDRVRLAMKLFDSEGVALVNTLAGGSEGLEEFARQSEKLGILLGTQASRIEQTTDALNRMKKAQEGVVQHIAVAMAPAITHIEKRLERIIKVWNKWLYRRTGGAGGLFGAAAESFTPPAEALMTATEKAAIAMKDAAAKIKEVELESEIAKRLKSAFSQTPILSAVTRATAQGFETLRTTERERADRERRHAEIVRLMIQILEEVKEGRLKLKPVGL